MENNELLYNLQKYDLVIKNATAELDSFLSGRDAVNAEIQNRAAEAAACERKIKANSNDTALLEKEIEYADSQIKKMTDRFLLIKTEKELSKYTAELERLNSGKGELEEKLLALMERHEKLSAKLKKLTAEYERVKNESVEKIAELDEKIAAARAELEKLEKHRREFASGIPAAALEEYSKLAAAKNGTPVALVSKKICSGCHLSISDNTLSQVKFKNSMVHCPNCQRIIFIEP